MVRLSPSLFHTCATQLTYTCHTGASLTRAGWSFDKTPRLSFLPNVARYRDRKLNRTCSYVGYDAYADATTRGQLRSAFEPGSSIVGNWDVMEGVLDYVFVKFGVDGAEGGVGRPIVMTEPIANLGYSRKSISACETRLRQHANRCFSCSND